MAGIKQHIIGVTVISAGVCAALPFRSGTTESPSRLTDSSASHESIDGEPLRLNLSIPAPQVIALEPEQEAKSPRTNTSVDSVFRRPLEELPESDVNQESVGVPPSVNSQFEPFVDTLPVSIEEQTRSSTPSKVNLTHRVIDGDTLESLAGRYLGNRDRWREILDANSDTLTSQDLLPIGAEISIRRTKSEPQGEGALPKTETDDNKLVPISAEALRASKKANLSD